MVRRFRRHVMPWHAILVLIANGEYRPESTLDLLEAMGLEDGVMDLVMVISGGRTRWIEVKLDRTPEHGRTDLFQAQIEMHGLFGYLDHKVDQVRSLQELWAIVEEEGIPHRPWAEPVHQDAFDFGRRRTRSARNRPP
jgi:hypothetical protein